jgi:hypothetical protein
MYSSIIFICMRKHAPHLGFSSSAKHCILCMCVCVCVCVWMHVSYCSPGLLFLGQTLFFSFPRLFVWGLRCMIVYRDTYLYTCACIHIWMNTYIYMYTIYICIYIFIYSWKHRFIQIYYNCMHTFNTNACIHSIQMHACIFTHTSAYMLVFMHEHP